MLGDLIQLGFPAHKARELRRQVVGRRCTGVQTSVADALVKGQRLRLRFDAQFLRQRVPTSLVLDQSHAALTAQRKGDHQLAMGLLAPGFQLQLTPGIMLGLPVLPVLIMAVCQVVECFHCLLVKVLLFHREPLLKGQTVEIESG